MRVRRLKQKAKREDVKGGGGKRGMEGYVGNGFVREGTEVKDRRKDGERENAPGGFFLYYMWCLRAKKLPEGGTFVIRVLVSRLYVARRIHNLIRGLKGE